MTDHRQRRHPPCLGDSSARRAPPQPLASRTCSSSPPSSILLLGMGYPLVWQVVTSMQEFGTRSSSSASPPPFVGLDNYVDLATDPTIWAGRRPLARLLLHHRRVTLVVGMLLALLMTAVGRAARLILQVVAAARLGDARRRRDDRLDLALRPPPRRRQLPARHDPRRRHEPLRLARRHPLTFFIVASIIVVWMSVPFVAFSVYAGLTQVSDEVLEAAQLDGANGWQRFCATSSCR